MSFSIQSYKGKPYNLDCLFIDSEESYNAILSLDHDISGTVYDSFENACKDFLKVTGIAYTDLSNGTQVPSASHTEVISKKPFYTFDSTGETVAYLYDLYYDSIEFNNYTVRNSTAADVTALTEAGYTMDSSQINKLCYVDNKTKLPLVFKQASGLYTISYAELLTCIYAGTTLTNAPIISSYVPESKQTTDNNVKYMISCANLYYAQTSAGTGFIWHIYSFQTVANKPIFSSYNNYLFINNESHDTEDSEDPYADDPSGTSTPTGSSDFSSDETDFSSNPTKSGLNTGLMTSYIVSSGNLSALATKLWYDDFIDLFKNKLFSNPIDAIIDLHITPIDLQVGASKNILLGIYDTEVSASLVPSRYVNVDCGTLTLNEWAGGFLNYAPYTKVSIYLPFIGVRELQTDDVMNTNIHVLYHCDVLSGDVVAQIKCSGGRNNRAAVLYHFNGNMNTMLPVSQIDYTNKYRAALSLTSAAIGFASGGLGVAGAIGSVAGVMSAKNNISRSGNISGTAGWMDNEKPYLIIQCPRKCVPSKQNKWIGYPALITRTVGQCSGFTKYKSVRVSSGTATDNELKMIEDLLLEGVIA